MLTERVMFLARGKWSPTTRRPRSSPQYGYDDLEDVFLSLAEKHGR